MSAETPADGGRNTNPFADLADFVAVPRVTGLRLSPDGSWLAATVQTLSADRKKYLTGADSCKMAVMPASFRCRRS